VAVRRFLQAQPGGSRDDDANTVQLVSQISSSLARVALCRRLESWGGSYVLGPVSMVVLEVVV